jgi:hypothetical protein
VSRSIERVDASVQTIIPVLKTFASDEVAIIGCHVSNLSRRSCEYDLLLVEKDRVPEKFVRVGDVYAELIFRTEKELEDPDPGLALELSSAVSLRDNSLRLATAITHCRRVFKANCRKATETHLASALKALARVDDTLSEKKLLEADLWLLSAGYDFAQAELLSRGTIPRPSHLLYQMKSVSKGRGAGFRQWAGACGLELASRASCEIRLEAVSIIYDVLRTTGAGPSLSMRLGRYASRESSEILGAKANEILASMESAECYSFLGQEVTKSLLDLYLLRASRRSREPDYDVTGDLTAGKDRLISMDVIKALGLVRTEQIIRTASEGLKSSVSLLAKRI